MKETFNQDLDHNEMERAQSYAPTESSIAASNAIKYTAYIMLLFGFLYFLAAYLGPML